MPQPTSEKSNICKGFSLSGSYRTKCGGGLFYNKCWTSPKSWIGSYGQNWVKALKKAA